MSEDDLKEIFKDQDALVFAFYKSIEGAISGAMNGLEEYRVGKKNVIGYSKEMLKNGVRTAIEEMAKNYIEKLPLKQKIVTKALMSLPWPDAIKLLSDAALNFGKKDDGSYKSTGDVILDGLKKYFGSG